jgi:hypothetical protein
MVERSRVYPKKLLFEKLNYDKPEDLGIPYVQTIPHVPLKFFTRGSLLGVLVDFTSKMGWFVAKNGTNSQYIVRKATWKNRN